jgi:hypothetical protein
MKTKYIIIGSILFILFLIGKFVVPQEATKPTEVAQTEIEPLTYAQKFDKKQFNEISGVYKPVRNYLKENLNDPSSLEIDKTWNLGMNKDSTFSIKTTFRAKNEYNALVLQAMYCNVDYDGNLSEIKIE